MRLPEALLHALLTHVRHQLFTLFFSAPNRLFCTSLACPNHYQWREERTPALLGRQQQAASQGACAHPPDPGGRTTQRAARGGT